MFIGISLTVLGVLVLLLQFVSVTTHISGIHIGPFKTSTEAHSTIPVSPFVGASLLAVGIVLVIIARKKKPQPGHKGPMLASGHGPSDSKVEDRANPQSTLPDGDTGVSETPIDGSKARD
jgi:hypothetical protein